MTQFDFSTFFSLLFWFFNFFFSGLLFYILYAMIPIHLSLRSGNWVKNKHFQKAWLLKETLRQYFLIDLLLVTQRFNKTYE